MQEGLITEDLPALFVTREIKEHANVFHFMTDLLNVYISLRMLGWDRSPYQILLMDDHPPGPMDPLWAAVATERGRPALQTGKATSFSSDALTLSFIYE